MGRRRTVGYVENVWTCPNCGGENKGSVKLCDACGAPQPENVQFHLPSEQKLVKDEAAIKTAQAGADIHCGFCGARNPATAETCSQCGGDLKEGKAREAGRIMQAPPPSPKVIKCNNCGTENPGTNSVCSNCGAALPKAVVAQAAAPKPEMAGGNPAAKKKPNWLLIGGIAGFFTVCCLVIGVLFLFPTSSVEATVTDVHWQTNVPVEEIRAVDYSNERGSPPSDAYNKSCYTESEDVCTTEFIDKGNGYSEEVEECHTESTQYCSYTVNEWQTIQDNLREGNDLQPIYANPNYSSNQRLGEKSEEFTVTFSTDSDKKIYSPNTISEFQKYIIGSTWTLNLNLAGGIISIEP